MKRPVNHSVVKKFRNVSIFKEKMSEWVCREAHIKTVGVKNQI